MKRENIIREIMYNEVFDTPAHDKSYWETLSEKKLMKVLEARKKMKPESEWISVKDVDEVVMEMRQKVADKANEIFKLMTEISEITDEASAKFDWKIGDFFTEFLPIGDASPFTIDWMDEAFAILEWQEAIEDLIETSKNNE